MSSMNDLEQDIEASRARLDQTIDQIQGRLTVSSLVDEMLGTARRTPLSGVYDGALDAVRRNPVPVMIIAAGVGWLLHRISNDAARRRTEIQAARVPVMNTGAARTYDPDLPTIKPGRDRIEDTQL